MSESPFYLPPSKKVAVFFPKVNGAIDDELDRSNCSSVSSADRGPRRFLRMSLSELSSGMNPYKLESTPRKASAIGFVKDCVVQTPKTGRTPLGTPISSRKGTPIAKRYGQLHVDDCVISTPELSAKLRVPRHPVPFTPVPSPLASTSRRPVPSPPPKRSNKEPPSSSDEAGESKNQQKKGPERRSADSSTKENPHADMYARARRLTNWIPRLSGEKFILEGDLMDLDAENPVHYPDRWLSSKVTERKTANLVLTRGKPYVIEGAMSVKYARIGNLPHFIISAFRTGFPEDWEVYKEQWKKLAKQQRASSADSDISTDVSTITQISRFEPTAGRGPPGDDFPFIRPVGLPPRKRYVLSGSKRESSMMTTNSSMNSTTSSTMSSISILPEIPESPGGEENWVSVGRWKTPRKPLRWKVNQSLPLRRSPRKACQRKSLQIIQEVPKKRGRGRPRKKQFKESEFGAEGQSPGEILKLPRKSVTIRENDGTSSSKVKKHRRKVDVPEVHSVEEESDSESPIKATDADGVYREKVKDQSDGENDKTEEEDVSIHNQSSFYSRKSKAVRRETQELSSEAEETSKNRNIFSPDELSSGRSIRGGRGRGRGRGRGGRGRTGRISDVTVSPQSEPERPACARGRGRGRGRLPKSRGSHVPPPQESQEGPKKKRGRSKKRKSDEMEFGSEGESPGKISKLSEEYVKNRQGGRRKSNVREIDSENEGEWSEIPRKHTKSTDKSVRSMKGRTKKYHSSDENETEDEEDILKEISSYYSKVAGGAKLKNQTVDSDREGPVSDGNILSPNEFSPSRGGRGRGRGRGRGGRGRRGRISDVTVSPQTEPERPAVVRGRGRGRGRAPIRIRLSKESTVRPIQELEGDLELQKALDQTKRKNIMLGEKPKTKKSPINHTVKTKKSSPIKITEDPNINPRQRASKSRAIERIHETTPEILKLRQRKETPETPETPVSRRVTKKAIPKARQLIKKIEVKNPFEVGEEAVPVRNLSSINKDAQLEKFALKPKTIKDRKTNERILRDLNVGHEDDLFTGRKKKDTGIPADNILDDLLESDSENNISVQTARTPVLYLDRTVSNANTPAAHEPIEKSTQEDHAFIHRKEKELKRARKLHPIHPATRTPLIFECGGDTKERTARDNKAKRYRAQIAKLQTENEPIDENDETRIEEYFPEDDDQSLVSFTNPPAGLMV